ncbi:MAG: cob(I)yrinic acid a,c-diamide adenosyltransferase [Myxococcota bacterium]
MKIYTRTGDAGETGLFGGPRVLKDDLRVSAYGELDEANSAVGLAISLGNDPELAAILRAIQVDLFDLGAVVATPPQKEATLHKRMSLPVDDARVAELEHIIDRMDTELTPLTTFVLPGGTSQAAALHVARTAVRRAERSLVTLHRESPLPTIVLTYVNRLSDLLFTLSRVANRRAGVPEPLWHPRRPAEARGP